MILTRQRFGKLGSLKITQCLPSGRWNWTLFSRAGRELAFSSFSYSRARDARIGAWRTMGVLRSLGK